jgi:ADP-ribose pyrophosphatase YjhB (NUDIX family)
MAIQTIKSFSAGGIVTNGKGEVVLVSQKKQGQGVASWSFPKGGIIQGESGLEAAIREIREESGVVQLDLVSELGTIERDKAFLDGIKDFFQIKIIQMFLFRTDQKELRPIDADNPMALWVKIEDVAKRLTHQKDRDFFLSVMDQVKKYSNPEA